MHGNIRQLTTDFTIVDLDSHPLFTRWRRRHGGAIVKRAATDIGRRKTILAISRAERSRAEFFCTQLPFDRQLLFNSRTEASHTDVALIDVMQAEVFRRGIVIRITAHQTPQGFGHISIIGDDIVSFLRVFAVTENGGSQNTSITVTVFSFNFGDRCIATGDAHLAFAVISALAIDAVRNDSEVDAVADIRIQCGVDNFKHADNVAFL